jgi:proteasome-associated ATPase
MPRTQQPTEIDAAHLELLLAYGEEAPSLEQKFELLGVLRGGSPERSQRLDHFLLENLTRARHGLAQAQLTHAQLQAMLEQLSAPPWYPALFLRAVPTAAGQRALVLHGGTRRLVALAVDVALESLAPGDEVFLGKDLNVITARAPSGVPQCGETAWFERATGDGRCVLRWRDEEVVVDAASTLPVPDLHRGDQVRWDRSAWMAFEKLARAAGERYLLAEVPTVDRAHVGGQDTNLDTLLSVLTATLVAPDKAARYGLTGRQSILMVGPPGCGKTLMARVAAAELSRLSGMRCRFAVVKPAEWESPWVGETQQNIRQCFEAIGKFALADGCAVLFLDEIESIGRIRGGAIGQHADKFLAALLAEINGFSDRPGLAIIAATNRKDLVDPALLERLSDVEIAVRRPDLRGAKAIFDIHLTESLLYYANGTALDTREEIIERAVSRFYSPNADNDLCTVRFRDGKTRIVVARDLASGRLFEQVCRAACRAAFLRDLRGGDVGLRVADMEDALVDAMQRLASTLSPRNAHAYLSDLPQDVDVVSVEPVVRKVPRPHRYLNAA